MSKPAKSLLQTFERTNGGVTGFAVALKQGGVEIILIAAERDQVAMAAEIAGLGEVNMDRIQNVVVLPRCSVLDEVKGD
jgi:predicted regulator of Ras-like GTPase activity (Roadblock/LC7/MglB family)